MIIKLMSFNVQHGRNHNLAGDVVDLPLMAKVIRDVSPLFVGLQEVYADQPSILSAMTGGSACFGRATIDEGKDYGNAVISHLPVLSCETIPIPDPVKRRYKGYYETRCVMKLSIDCKGKPVTLLVSHFGLNPDEHENAVNTVINIASACGGPVILMGDLNMRPGEAPLQRLASQFADAAKILNHEEWTFPSHCPDRRIDYFWYRDAAPVSIQAYKVVASDHLPLVAEFEV